MLLALVTLILLVVVLWAPGSATGDTGAVAAGRAVAGLKLCVIYNGERARGCDAGGVATAPAGVVHELKVSWDWHKGDSVRIVGVQTDPSRRPLGNLRVCTSPPCYAKAPPPRYGGIVAANYVAVLLRAGKQSKSNVIRLAWLTKKPTSMTLESDGLFTCTKRLPNDGTPGAGLICRGTITLPSREEVLAVPNGTSLKVTGRVNPGLPDGWALIVREQGGHIVCQVPREHPSTTKSCTGDVNALGGVSRENRLWPFDLQVIEYDGNNYVGFTGIGEVQLWWGCPFRGYIPQCP